MCWPCGTSMPTEGMRAGRQQRPPDSARKCKERRRERLEEREVGGERCGRRARGEAQDIDMMPAMFAEEDIDMLPAMFAEAKDIDSTRQT